METLKDMDVLVSLCKRRGIIFQSSEIYGGLGNFWDYGPMGVELKKNVKNEWWKNTVQMRDDVVGVDTCIILHPRAWAASGHVASFFDPLVDCKSCKKRFRADHLPVRMPAQAGERTQTGLTTPNCPECGGELTEERNFNLMFETYVGPVKEDAAKVYMRPETAQGIFIAFQQILQTARVKIPFGVAQIGKSFRNEVSPGNFIFRTREFEQMELEFFAEPGTDDEWFKFWVEERLNWYIKLGVKKENLRLRRHEPKELAHYAKDCYDIEYKFPFGWQEIEGIANRTDFDLSAHTKESGKDLKYFDEKKNERYIPYVIESSAGVERPLLVFLADAFYEEEVKNEKRVVLNFHPKIAPVKAAIFPLVKKEGLPEVAQKINQELRKHFTTFYDDSGSIGRRYRRQDEIGTPFAVTVDFDTLKDETVTLRDRNTMQQERHPIAALEDVIRKKLEAS